jgi:hypothetical protein
LLHYLLHVAHTSPSGARTRFAMIRRPVKHAARRCSAGHTRRALTRHADGTAAASSSWTTATSLVARVSADSLTEPRNSAMFLMMSTRNPAETARNAKAVAGRWQAAMVESHAPLRRRSIRVGRVPS